MNYIELISQLGLDKMTIKVTLKVPVRSGDIYKSGEVIGVKPGRRGGGHHDWRKNEFGQREAMSFDSSRIHWLTPIRVCVAYSVFTFGKTNHTDWVPIDNCEFEIVHSCICPESYKKIGKWADDCQAHDRSTVPLEQ